MRKKASGGRKDKVTEWAIGQPLRFPPKAAIKRPLNQKKQQSKTPATRLTASLGIMLRYHDSQPGRSLPEGVGLF